MAKPIVIPPPASVEDQLKAMMRDPKFRRAVKKNPLLVDRFRAMLMARQEQPNRPVGPGGPGRQAYRRPYVGSTFAAAPVMVEGDTSLAAVVRAQRDSFLVDDGMQVAGDYTDAIRKQAGGRISPPEMPPVGYSAAFYSYPSDAMRTGAALGRMVRPRAASFTSSRKPLPTASFWPGAFVTARPDSINRTLITNKPVPMPRETVRGVRREMRRDGIVTSSPSTDRRRSLTTLMGLGGVAQDPRAGAGRTFLLLADFLENDKDYNAKYRVFAASLRGMFNLLASIPEQGQMDDEEKQRWGFVDNISTTEKIAKQTVYYLLYGLKVTFEQVILTLILADKFDLNSLLVKTILDATPLKKAAPDGDYNKAVNERLSKFYGDTYSSLIMALGGKMPFDLKVTGVREYFIKYLYRRIWGSNPSTVVYNAISTRLACEELLGSRVDSAIGLMMRPEFEPGKTPRAATCPAADAVKLPELSSDTGAGAGGGGQAETPVNMKLVKAGIFGGLALLAVGVYAKVR